MIALFVVRSSVMVIQVEVVTTKPARVLADFLVIVAQRRAPLGAGWDKPGKKRLADVARSVGFRGDWGQGELLPFSSADTKARFIGLAGLGERTESTERQREGIRRAIGKLVQEGRRHRLRSLAVDLSEVDNAPDLAAAAVEAAELATYRFADFSSQLRREQRQRALKKIIFVVSRADVGAVRTAVNAGRVVLNGVTMARTLVNQPASNVSPAILVAKAKEIAAANKRVQVHILDDRQAEKAGFTAFLAVARGSSEKPYVIHLKYAPAAAPTKKIFLVGKGITFDSGGLSIKPARFMETMKSDMAGAASVLGLFSVIEKLAPACEVHGVIATCENMPSGSAYRPGDILRAKNGKTIEVLDTDAEGRITLADALSFAAEHKPDAIIDLATLTGACMIALGETVAGLWSNNDDLQTALLAAAGRTGEGLCPMPLPEEYMPHIKSEVADLRNIPTSRFGDAISAALFLREFVGAVPWAHLDIAGPSYLERSPLSYFAPGGTGYGVRMMAEFIKAY